MDNINNNLNNLIKVLKILIFTTLVSLIIFFNASFVYANTNVKLISPESTVNKSINITINNTKTAVPHINLNKRLYSVNYFKKHKKQYEAALKKCKTLNYQTASLTARNNCSKATMLKFFKVIKIKKK
jgi:hypothetical protein